MERAMTLFCFLALCSWASVSVAQDTSCLNDLVPCLQYINSTQTPSSSCCNPLKSLIKSDPLCLCNLLGGNSATKQAGVNMTQALLLPAKCGEKVNASMCSKASQKDKNTVTNSAGQFGNQLMAALFLSIQAMWAMWL